MKVIVTESKIGIEYLADVISSCDQNGIECIVDDNAGEILYYLPKEGRYGDDKLLQNSDESIFDLVQDKEHLVNVLKDAQGDEFKEFAVKWNDLQKKGEDDEVYKTQHCNPIRGNFAESSFGCKYAARSLEEKVATWYRKAYPSDKEMADEMRPRRSTFQDVIDALESGEDVYEVIGADDSIVRERVFEELSKLTGKDYDYFYDKWLYGGDKKTLDGIEAQFSEGDESDDWSASEGEVEIIWDTTEFLDEFGMDIGDTETLVIDYDRVDTHDMLIEEVIRLLEDEYPGIVVGVDDFVIDNEDEFWEQRGGNPGKLEDDELRD